MSRYACLMRVLVLLLLTGQLSGQEVIYEHSPIPIGNPATDFIGLSSVQPVSEFGLPIPVELETVSRGYDSFTLTEEFSISGIGWKGSYNGEFNPNEEFRGIADFEIEFFPDSSNRPNTLEPIASFTLDGGTAGRNDGTQLTSMIVPNELSQGGNSSNTNGVVETYSADLEPFVLQPGTYWLAIQAQLSYPSPFPPQSRTDPNRWYDPQWSWVLSRDDADGNDSLYSFDTQFGDVIDPATGNVGPGIIINDQGDLSFSLVGSEPVGLTGDYDDDGDLDAMDVDLLTAGIRTCGTACTPFDLNQDGSADNDDLVFWVESIKGTLLGDATLDGTIQFVDFLALSRSFGGEGGWADGNFTIDTEVGFTDFLILSRNFGQSVAAPVGAEAAAVPEPASCLLLAFAGLFVGLVRRRRSD